MKTTKTPAKSKKNMANGGMAAPAVMPRGPAQMTPGVVSKGPAQMGAPTQGAMPRPAPPAGGMGGLGARAGQAMDAMKARMGDRPTPRLDAMKARMQERQAARPARVAAGAGFRAGMGGGPMAGRIPAQQNPGMKQPGGYMANGGKVKPKARGR